MAKSAVASTKVGPGAKAPKAEKPKKEKIKRSAFRAPNEAKLAACPPFATFNEKGELVTPDGAFSPKLHTNLKKGDFENSLEFAKFGAQMNRFRGQSMILKGDRAYAKAERMALLGDDKQRKEAAKLSRLRKQFLEMEARMTADMGPEAVAAILAST